MLIKTLLEADAYRFQPEWKNVDDPVIHMTARTTRKSSSSTFEAYGLAYGMELNGVDCPRRWKSTFATTNPGKSHFMTWSRGADQGTRKLNIPAGVKVAAVEDDFNMHGHFTSVLVNLNSSMYDITQNLEFKLADDPDNNELKSLIHDTTEWRKSYLALYVEQASDPGYDWFKELLDDYDKVIHMVIIGSQLVPKEILGFGSLKAALKDQVENVLDVQKVRVFDSIEQVPEGQALEVWFEGDYDAQLITPDEISAVKRK